MNEWTKNKNKNEKNKSKNKSENKNEKNKSKNKTGYTRGPRVSEYRLWGGGYDVESPDCSIQLGGVVRGIGTRQLDTAEQSRAEQSRATGQTHPSREWRLSHFQRSYLSRDQERAHAKQ